MTLSPRIPRAVKTAAPKRKEGNSPAYLSWVRSLGCVVCHLGGSEAHHLLRSDDGHKGTSQKSADKWAIPLCRSHHTKVHIGTVRPDDAGLGRDEAWLMERHGIDARGLCKRLWFLFQNEDDIEERDRLGLRAVERARMK